MSKHLAICGNGASAAALLVALAKRRLPLQVTVIGNGPLWRGVAYSTTSPHHLLNVPSGNMSIDSEDQDHFQRWLALRHTGGESLFAPRGLYGAYIEDSVHRTLRAAPWLRVEHISAELLGLTRQPDRWHVFHALGVLSADAVVLATGIERPSPLGARYGKAVAQHVVEDPWAPWRVKSSARILILGTGLTAVDSVLTLTQGGHYGPITMVSPRGLLPLAHVPVYPQAVESPTPMPLSCRLGNLRARAGEARHWQDSFDSWRPHWQRIWEDLSDVERQRFLRHGVSHFNIHRHRMAPQAADAIEAAMRRNLAVQRGRIVAMVPHRGSLGVTIRHGGHDQVLGFDHVINCTGPNSNFSLSGQTFIQTLIGAGVARPDPVGLGIEVDAHDRVHGREGEVQHSLFAMGALCRGRRWEITAMPEIRQQAAQMARSLWVMCAPESETSFAHIFSAPNSNRLFTREDHEYYYPPTGA